MITASEALRRLKDGNNRFVSGEGGRDLEFEHARRLELREGQAPFAIVLGCSDSRVPLELVFDQGLGDLFVIRVAGNIAAPSQLASIEYAAANLGTPLLVVLGHSRCGAVAAAVDGVLDPSPVPSPNLALLVDRIRPAVEGLLERQPGTEKEALLRESVAANVRRTLEQLTHDSGLLEDLVRKGSLTIVGAEYSLETGVVEFLD